MEKTYKRVPFDIELAKKIQTGEIEGRIVTGSGILVQLLCFDRRDTYQIVGMQDNKDIFFYTWKGYSYNDENIVPHRLFIELPEETPKQEFKPFDKVLVRDFPTNRWFINLFSHYGKQGNKVTHNCMYGDDWIYCIPYEGNEHLVGTTNNPKEE